jgi:hypothetical protein
VASLFSLSLSLSLSLAFFLSIYMYLYRIIDAIACLYPTSYFPESTTLVFEALQEPLAGGDCTSKRSSCLPQRKKESPAAPTLWCTS